MMSIEKEIYLPLFDAAIRHYLPGRSGLRVLEIGCGEGALVAAFREAGYDAYGCDVDPTAGQVESEYTLFKSGSENTRTIAFDPYKLPFESNEFDVVVSSNTFEHVLNKRETLNEILRVLKPGGYTFNAFPSKWYLPSEPHIFVPFVSWMWPDVPSWWLSLWALLGIRNGYQKNISWQKASSENKRFCEGAISYISHDEYRKLVKDVFGNYEEPYTKYVEWHHGGSSKAVRNLPKIFQYGISMWREQFFVAKKNA